ncbi:hypothetical protein ACQEU5_04750 [Marinactinospora thermotolerans]|uniref:Uncharacterized protein n=1 Tax=Marinactinospora thermotolerans DSM 45154 TaxID=1122192 RepID=A0A1T4QI37_9ACTN|nr:hypothetical protein [Marinactinospora thermotolerans]SKA03364.1 hypothetical protein SAMN02745673_02243 [Marinactinospora thermotolerans DSM 45154]
MVEIVGILVLIQGVLGFAGPFLDREMGLLHLWFDLSQTAYLGIAVLGLVLTVLGGAMRRGRKRAG